MKKVSVIQISSWALAAFFVIGAFANLFPSVQTAENYARWGYPVWFHYVTGVLELITVFMLISSKTRIIGILLVVGIMVSAIATVLFHGETGHALLPFIVLCVAAALAFVSMKK